jgi:hypothetical protein
MYMSFYTEGLKSHVVDAVHHSSNFRTEFRLKPNTVYLTNFRLANLGVSLSGATQYNPLAGISSTIRSIHLYDGNQLLDQILEFPLWAGFTAYNRANKSNEDLQRQLNLNQLGFVYEGLDLPAADGGSSSTDIAKIRTKYDPPQPHGSQPSKGWLSLKGILPMLDASLYCPTTVFKNLRLVIEWNTNKGQMTVDDNGTASTAGDILEPVLLVDEVVNPERQAQIAKQYKGVQFNAIEHDRVPINAIAVGAGSVEQTKTVGGFDNKRVNRFLIVNTPQAVATTDACMGLGSTAMFKEKIQIRINGSNRYPADGITRPNQRLALLTDVWGSCNAFPGTNTVLCGTDVADDDKKIERVATTRTFGGNLDYFGCTTPMDEPVLEFQIDHTRYSETSASAPQYGAMNLNVFGEVMKQIVVAGNGYRVVYL